MTSTTENLIVLGSNKTAQTKKVEYYDSQDNVWKKAFELDIDVWIDYKSTMYEGKLVLVTGQVHGVITNRVASYDLSTGEMTDLPPLNDGGINVAIAVVSRYLYVLGGTNPSPKNRVERFNPFSKEWENVAPLLTERYKFGAVVFNGEIYAMGGRNDHGWLSDVEAYNPIADSWRKCTPMNEKRFGPATTTLGKFIYAIGGSNSTNVFNTGERYDSVTETWSYIENLSFSLRYGEAIIFNYNKILIAGGYDAGGHQIDNVELYDPEKNQFSNFAPLTEPRGQFSLVRAPWSPSK